jgi:hypothetical protein
MAFGQMPFAVRQAVGEWAERTLIDHFSKDSKYVAVHYGERWSGKRKRIETDPANRPDLLILPREALSRLESKGISPLLLDLTQLADDDPQVLEIVKEARVALEAKVSFRYYEKGHVNFIIDEEREKRYKVWRSRMKGIGSLVIWFTLDKAFIASMEMVLAKGEREERSYEGRGRMARTKMTYNLPVENAEPFADVSGVRLNETLKPVLKRSESGAVSITIEDDPGVLQNVNVEALERLADEVKQ